MRQFIKKIFRRFFFRKEVIDNSNSGFSIVGDLRFLKIGKRVAFGGNVLLYLNAPLEIGDDTIIAINTVIHTTTHDYNNYPTWQERIDKPIKIGKNVWIGLNSIILAGVIIGDNAVIAAGSVVVNSVPENAIVAGNPARIIKFRDIKQAKFINEIEYPGVIVKAGYDCREVKKKK